MKLIPMPRLIQKTQEKIINKKVKMADMDLDLRLEKAIQKLHSFVHLFHLMGA